LKTLKSPIRDKLISLHNRKTSSPSKISPNSTLILEKSPVNFGNARKYEYLNQSKILDKLVLGKS
jgi:hypothetical protein